MGTGGSAAESAAAVNETNINSLWVLIAAAMVFLMQPGFLCFEVGCVRPNSIVSVAMKNLVDWVMVAALFFLVGFGLMFGTSWGGVIGTDFFLLQGIGVAGGTISPFVFFLFQLAFAATAATIVSGAMSERTGFVTYLMASGIVGLFIYPVFGHWGWGNLLLENNETWLTRLGFMDFAGSTVVHSVGGWVALVGVWFLGARLGRYDSEGNLKPVEAFSFPIASLGLFILWFGWWGFNGGSTLAMNGEVGCIIVNTVIAAAAAGMGAFIHSWFVQQKADIHEKFMGGILGGLVAITACCNVVTPISAFFVGLSAAVVHNRGFDFIVKKCKLDDPVGAIPVHLICGIWGTLCVGLVGRAELLARPRLEQIGVQLVGIFACMLWTAGASIIMFKVLKATVGLRVSPQEEMAGINIAHQVEEPPNEHLDLDGESLQELLGELSAGDAPVRKDP